MENKVYIVFVKEGDEEAYPLYVTSNYEKARNVVTTTRTNWATNSPNSIVTVFIDSHAIEDDVYLDYDWFQTYDDMYSNMEEEPDLVLFDEPQPEEEPTED